MPTIYSIAGLTVKIYTRDHRPPHVHVFRQDGGAIIAIGGPGEEPLVREVNRMRTRDVLHALEIVRENQMAFLAAWRKYHGN